MKLSYQIFAFVFLFLLGSSHVVAKENSQLTGQVKDSQGEVLPFANVALLEASSVKLVTGAVSDEDGRFSISTSQSGKFILKVSSIGFETFFTEPFEINGGDKIEFGTIQVEEEMSSLGEVEVRAARPEVTIEADKTTINIEGTVMAEGNTALDVVGRSPGVFVDQEGNINLNGRPGVTVMINDRQTYMSAQDLANFLRAMPAENIKSIEVINNPSSRFDAEGAAGVINIKLKKNNLDGVFGNVQAGNQYNGMYAPFGGATINVKKGKWTTNTSFNYSEYNILNELEINRNFPLEDGVSNFFQDTDMTMKRQNYFFNGGADYEISKNHSVGVNIQASENRGGETSESLTEITNPGAPMSFIGSQNDNRSDNQRLFANLHYVGQLDSVGTKLTSDIDYTKMNASSEGILSNRYWTGEDESLFNRDRIQTLNDMEYHILTAKVDFIKPIGEKGNMFETGLKGSWVRSDNDLRLSRSVEEEPFMPDPNSNQFLYKEQVLAGYASYKGGISPKINYQAGLRGEYSDIEGNSLTMGQINTQRYFSLFPSLFVQHKVSDDYQINYNVNRRITRPNYRLLNPFVFYIDPLTTEQGNPHLRPQFSNNFEMNHVIKRAYQVSLSYSETHDVFQQIFMQDEATRTTTTYTANFDKSRNFNFRGIIPVDITPWWNTSNMVQVSHNAWTSMIGDAMLDVSQFSYMGRTQHNIMLPKGFKLELVGMYLGPQLYGQARIDGFGWVDAGISKSVMKDKMSITLNGSDIFRTQIIRADVQFDQMDTQFQQYRSNQSVRLTLRYKFAQGESFRVSNRSGSKEERDRLGE
ncbi:outer membrane beta-barrel protein [Litoribacter alkaliphilus]|uniref:Outer membrane beta-barrel protein n=1 Tax=Litoribacter ruber TaxID=702568 RepID=A0AAP2CM31_9BACT|nr:outer membrane beta-barrel protein [Litoribacter alkaliphilus]MBS9524397.1 outer membrane beta-barrel protein [Litoribacter alkaliphilus]